MIRLGWGVFVRALPDVVSTERLRRMVLVAVIAFVAVAAVLVLTEQLFHWVDASMGRVAVGFALTAVAGGVLAAAFVRLRAPDDAVGSPTGPLGSRPQASAPRPARDWRAQDRLVQYLGWSPPPIRAEDREMVLDDVAVGRHAVARTVVHSGLGTIAFVFAAAGLFGGGILRVNGSWFPFFSLMWPAATVFQQLLTLGRGERARRQAEAIPPQVRRELAPPRPPGNRPPRPPGSKLSLPDE